MKNLINIIFSTSVLLASVATFADQPIDEPQPAPQPPTVEIEYFGYVDLANNGNPTAVLCGQVHGTLNHHMKIIITVDPRSNLAPEFVTLPGPNGRFCQTVATYTGRAQVEIRLPHHDHGVFKPILATASRGAAQ